MNIKKLLSYSLVLPFILSSSSLVSARSILPSIKSTPSIRQSYVYDEVIIKYKDSTSGLNKENIKAQYHLIKKQELSMPNTELVKITDGRPVEKAAEILNKDPRVDFAQPNFIYYPTTNDSYYNLEWGLNNIGQNINGITGTANVDIDASEAWTSSGTMGKSNMVIAVIDTGIDISHEDLKNNIWVNNGEIPGDGLDNDGNGYIDDVNGWNFCSNNNNLYSSTDGDFHGTHVAGTIAAQADNSIGISGVSPGVKIMSLKFIGANGGYTSDAIEAIYYAKKKGADLANNSWGGGTYDTALYNAINDFNKPFIAAAGNNGLNAEISPMYPAAYDCGNVVSVAAVDNQGNLASFSNYGPQSVDVGAPGVNIVSCYPANSYAFMSGTSMAAPHVSGVVALMLSVNPNLTSSEVRDILISSSNKLNSLTGKTVSGGMVNAMGAILSADTMPPNVITTNPVSNAVNVALDKVIEVSFNENITVVGGITLMENNNPVLFSVAVSGNTLSINTTLSMKYGTKYTLKIPAGAVKDASGNLLANDYNFSFTTLFDTVAPVLSSIVPKSGTANVSVNTQVVFTFSEDIKPENLNLIKFLAGTVPVTFSTSIMGNQLIIKPSKSLKRNTKYTVTLPAGTVGDLAGNKTSADYLTNFITTR